MGDYFSRGKEFLSSLLTNKEQEREQQLQNRRSTLTIEIDNLIDSFLHKDTTINQKQHGRLQELMRRRDNIQEVYDNYYRVTKAQRGPLLEEVVNMLAELKIDIITYTTKENL